MAGGMAGQDRNHALLLIICAHARSESECACANKPKFAEALCALAETLTPLAVFALNEQLAS